MTEYTKEIEGTNSLEDINLAIANEEAARPARFLDSNIAPHEGRITNLAKFERLPPRHRPSRIVVVKQEDAAPDGKSKVWSGAMVVSV